MSAGTFLLIYFLIYDRGSMMMIGFLVIFGLIESFNIYKLIKKKQLAKHPLFTHANFYEEEQQSLTHNKEIEI